MGMLRSASDCTGMTVRGVTLGDPTFTDDAGLDADPLFGWDHERLPNGVIEDDGTVVPDSEEIA